MLNHETNKAYLNLVEKIMTSKFYNVSIDVTSNDDAMSVEGMPPDPVAVFESEAEAITFANFMNDVAQQAIDNELDWRALPRLKAAVDSMLLVLAAPVEYDRDTKKAVIAEIAAARLACEASI